MTETEITLFKEMIKETVRSVIKEEKFKVTEEVKKAFAKDLKEIKLLIARQIKENRDQPKFTQVIESKQSLEDTPKKLSESRAQALKNILAGQYQPAQGTRKVIPSSILKSLKESKIDPSTKAILVQTALSTTEEDLDEMGIGTEIVDYEESESYNVPDDTEDAYQPKFSNGMPDFPG